MIHLLKAEKWRPQSSQIAIFTFSHWAFSGFLSRNLCWVRDRRNAPAEKKASGRQASTKVSSLTTQHLSVSNRFTGCRARLMSIHDAKTLGEPSSSSSNTQRFKRNMFLSLVSYPYWYHILTWSNHHGTTKKKWNPSMDEILMHSIRISTREAPESTKHYTIFSPRIQLLFVEPKNPEIRNKKLLLPLQVGL